MAAARWMQGICLLVQVDQTGQVLVAVICNLLVACEQLLSTVGECTGQAAVTGLVCQQCLILVVVHGLGGQSERVLALSLVGRVEGEQVPVTSLNCLLHLVLAVGHAALDTVQLAGSVADDQGRAGISLSLGNGLDSLSRVSTQCDLSNIDVTVGHSDLGQALLADLLTSSSELADFTNVGSLGCLSTGVGVHLSIEDHHVDILAGSQNVVQTTEADVVCPAVTTEDPDGLLGDELLALQDLCRLLAAGSSSLLQLSDQGLCGLVVGLGVVLGSDELLVSSLQLCGCLVGTSNLCDLLDQVLADGLLADVAQTMLCVILEQELHHAGPWPLSLLTVYGEMDAVPPQMEEQPVALEMYIFSPNS